MTEVPKSPSLVTLCIIPFVCIAACFLLVMGVNNERDQMYPSLDAIAAMGAWADIFMILGIVSAIGAIVLNGVISALVTMAETRRVQQRD